MLLRKLFKIKNYHSPGSVSELIFEIGDGLLVLGVVVRISEAVEETDPKCEEAVEASEKGP